MFLKNTWDVDVIEKPIKWDQRNNSNPSHGAHVRLQVQFGDNTQTELKSHYKSAHVCTKDQVRSHKKSQTHICKVDPGLWVSQES